MTPSDRPSLSTSGAHITERMRKSAMLWLVSKRASFAASAERIASWLVITWLTIVRLMRIWSSMSGRRCLMALGTSTPSAIRKITNPRSAWMKILNRLSSNLPSTSSKLTALPRLCAISIMARSFTSGLTVSRRPELFEATSSLDMMVEVAVWPPSSTIMARDESVRGLRMRSLG